MGIALELVTVQATAPGAAFVAMTANTGDSTVIRNTAKKVNLLAAWQARQVAGFTRIVSPLLHDNVRGIQLGGAVVGGVGPEITMLAAPLQQLYSQDVLSFSATGSAVAGQIEQSSILVRYDDLPGIDGQFIGYDELLKRAANRTAVRVTPGVVATGQYGAAVAINSLDDSFKANTDYAILGISGHGASQCIGIKSPDWGNLRIGVPGSITQAFMTSDWFTKLTLGTGTKCIPVFNSSNKLQTFVDFAGNQAVAAQTVTIQLVELK